VETQIAHQGEVFVKKLIGAAAAAALALSPTVAAAQSAPVEVAPAAEQAEGEQIRGGFILPLTIIVAIIIGVLLLTKDKDNDAEPMTP
jgi:heme/copper-type cytochrome/quinol oxidase subunit 2